MNTRILSSLVLVFSSATLAFSQTTSLDVENLINPLTDLTGVALTAGTGQNGDGALIEIGYYTGAIAGNASSLFSGNFVALTGPNGANPSFANNSSIGDWNSGASGPFGLFALHFDFVSNVNIMPAANTPLAVRFYNAPTLAGATLFNAVSSASDSDWNWMAPTVAGSSMVISFNDAVAWQDSTHAFQTSLATAVPEPSTYAAILGSMVLGLVGYRRYRRK